MLPTILKLTLAAALASALAAPARAETAPEQRAASVAASGSDVDAPVESSPAGSPWTIDGGVEVFARGGLGGGGAGRGGNTRGPSGRRPGGDRPNGVDGGAGGGADGAGSGTGSGSRREARAAERATREIERNLARCKSEAEKTRAVLARHGAAKALRAYQRVLKYSRKTGPEGLKIEHDVLAATLAAARRELDSAEAALDGPVAPPASLGVTLRDLARALRDTNEALSARAALLRERLVVRRSE